MSKVQHERATKVEHFGTGKSWRLIYQDKKRLSKWLPWLQGIQKWVALDSQQGGAVGAVQIKAALVQAAGTAISNHAGSR